MVIYFESAIVSNMSSPCETGTCQQSWVLHRWIIVQLSLLYRPTILLN